LALKDKKGAIFHVAVLFLTRIFLGIGPSINATNWLTTAIPAVLCLLYNVFFWPWEHKKQIVPLENVELDELTGASESPLKNHNEKNDNVDNDKVIFHAVPSSPSVATTDSSPSKTDLPTSPSSAELDQEVFATQSQKLQVKSRKMEAKMESTPSPFDASASPTTKGSVLALPWAVLPFLFGMFTLVQGLKNGGWIDIFSQGIVSAIPAEESTRAIFIATFLMATVSFVLCNLINNQPASILLAHVIVAPLFGSLPAKVQSAGMFGVIEGANVGANWTIIGALAGILWSTILRNKGIVIEYLGFLKNGLMVMPLVTASVALIIFLEHL